MSPAEDGALTPKELSRLAEMHNLMADARRAGKKNRWDKQTGLAFYVTLQSKWSRKTFGPGRRTEGVLDHIRKELKEVKKHPWDVMEYVDVAILALDGAQRICRESGLSAYETGHLVGTALERKALLNRARKWPNWRTADPHKAIEHADFSFPQRDGER